MRIVLCPTLHEHDREVTLLDRLMRGTTDGAVLMLPEESSAELKTLQRDFPFVVVDPRIRSTRASRSSRPRTQPARALRPSTCSRSGTGGSARSPARPTGSRARSASTAITARSPPQASLPGPVARRGVGLPQRPDHGSGRARLLDLPDPPTAIFAFNDNVAVGVMQGGARARSPRPRGPLGRRLRRLRAGRDRHAALTTVRQPLAEMGRMAVSLLLRLLENQRLDALRIELATKLVVRESTAPTPRQAVGPGGR